MNKNLLIAVLLMLGTFWFFNSRFYYEKILRQPFPARQTENNQPAGQKSSPPPEVSQGAPVAGRAGETPPETSTLNTRTDSLKTMAPAGDTIWIENEKIVCGIAEAGARIISLQMKGYTFTPGDKRGDSANKRIDLVADGELGGANLTINGKDYDRERFIAATHEKWLKLSRGEIKEVDFLTRDENNNPITKRFTFEGNTYKIRVAVLSKTLDGKSIITGWKGGISQSDQLSSTGKSSSGMNEPRKVHINDTKNFTHIQLKKIEKQEITGFYKWAAITSKYFMVALVADSARSSDLLLESYEDPATTDIVGKKNTFQADYSIQMRRSAEGTIESYWIFAGPTELKLLNSFHENFQKVLFSGWEWLLRADIWFPFICEITLWLLIFLDGFIKDYGITILLLTLLTRIITYPLSQSSMRSMSRMKELQPKINHIRERYKTNARKMNEETMALYKKEGVNPFNPGCLPMFLQMPILFALYIVLRKAIELRGAHTILIPWVKDLSQPETLFSLTGIFPTGIPLYGSSVALLPIIMAILTFFQNKMTIKDPNQKMMIYFMPVFMLVIFNNFASGLVLYWTFSNALGILQQYLLEKSLKTKSATAPVAAASEKPVVKRR